MNTQRQTAEETPVRQAIQDHAQTTLGAVEKIEQEARASQKQRKRERIRQRIQSVGQFTTGFFKAIAVNIVAGIVMIFFCNIIWVLGPFSAIALFIPATVNYLYFRKSRGNQPRPEVAGIWVVLVLSIAAGFGMFAFFSGQFLMS
jgi:hypothetical protein